MFSFDYDDWKKICSQIESQKSGRLSMYLQWYPFKMLSAKEKAILVSEEFLNDYINSGLFLFNSESWLITNNYIIKGDGNFRNASLVAPIMYLVALMIGKSISKSYQSHRQPTIDVFFAGSYRDDRIYYKKDYDLFFKRINNLAKSYNYFIKTDIKDFFTNINMNKLFDIINQRFAETNVQISQKDLLVYKELLLCLGQGEFPLIENCTSSSYLATVVYLEIPDEKLHKFINDKVSQIKEFNMVRYVDDLYILFNSNLPENKITPIVNRILNSYSSELNKLNLSLNREKTLWKAISNINEELKKTLYDDEFKSKKREFNDLVDKSLLLQFFKCIEEASLDFTLDAGKYSQLINEIFNIPETIYTPQEIYNSFVYGKHELFKDPNVIEIMLSLIKRDFNILKLDTKRITIMMLKTENEHLIKTVLAKSFSANRNGVWNDYDTSFAINYLLQRNFKNLHLLRILSGEEKLVYSYCMQFCKSSFMDTIKNSEMKYKDKFKETLFFRQDNKLFFLYFMYFIELKKSNYLSSFAYYKNFFDRISAHLAYSIEGIKSKTKPKYNDYYKECNLKKLYASIPDSDKIIGKAHKLRNSNPLSHASAELIDSQNTRLDLLNCIEELEDLVKIKIMEHKKF